MIRLWGRIRARWQQARYKPMLLATLLFAGVVTFVIIRLINLPSPLPADEALPLYLGCAMALFCLFLTLRESSIVLDMSVRQMRSKAYNDAAKLQDHIELAQRGILVRVGEQTELINTLQDSVTGIGAALVRHDTNQSRETAVLQRTTAGIEAALGEHDNRQAHSLDVLQGTVDGIGTTLGRHDNRQTHSMSDLEKSVAGLQTATHDHDGRQTHSMKELRNSLSGLNTTLGNHDALHANQPQKIKDIQSHLWKLYEDRPDGESERGAQ